MPNLGGTAKITLRPLRDGGFLYSGGNKTDKCGSERVRKEQVWKE